MFEVFEFRLPKKGLLFAASTALDLQIARIDLTVLHEKMEHRPLKHELIMLYDNVAQLMVKVSEAFAGAKLAPFVEGEGLRTALQDDRNTRCLQICDSK